MQETIKRYRRKSRQALAYLIIVCMVFTGLITMPQKIYADTNEAYLLNGLNLSTLAATPVTVFGSKDMTGGMGFLGNYYYLADTEMAALRTGEETAVDLGVGDSWIENVSYSAMEDHGTKTWIYSSVSGLDLQALFHNFGVTDASASLGVKSSDGMTYSLANAFEDRYYFDPEGVQSTDAVSPILALFRNTKEATTAPGAGNLVDVPTTATSSTMSRFGFGQTAADEHTGCSWVKTVNKVVVGPEGTAQRALTVNSNGSEKGISLWEMIRAGVYETSYTYTKDNTEVTHDLQGIPLSRLLEIMSVTVSNTQKLEIYSSDGYSVSPVSYEEIENCFVAYEAKEEGSLLANSSALRLYRPGQFGNTVVVKNLSALTVADITTQEAQIDYTVYYYQTKARAANSDQLITGWGTPSKVLTGTVGQTATINAPEIPGWAFAGYDDANGNMIATSNPEVKLTLSDDSSKNVIKLRYNINAGFTIAGSILNQNYWYSYDELVDMAQDAENYDVLNANNDFTTNLYSVIKRGAVPGNMFGAGIDIETLLGVIGGTASTKVSLYSTDGATQQISQGNFIFGDKKFTSDYYYYPETLAKGANASNMGNVAVPPMLAFKVKDISWIYDQVDNKGEPLAGAVVTYTPTLDNDVKPVQDRIAAETEDIGEWEASAAYPYPLLMLGQSITGDYNNQSYFKMVHAITAGTLPTLLTVESKTNVSKTYNAVTFTKLGFEKIDFAAGEEGMALDRIFKRIPVAYETNDEITFLNGEDTVTTIKGRDAADYYVSLNVDRSTHILSKTSPMMLVYQNGSETVKTEITNIKVAEPVITLDGKEKGGDVENAVFYIAVQEETSGPISYYYYTQEELERYETTKDFLYNDHTVKKKVTAKGAALDELLADLKGVTITKDMIVQYAEEDGYHAEQATAIDNASYKDKVDWLTSSRDVGGTTIAPAQTVITYLIHEEYETPDSYNVNDGPNVWKDADKSTGYLRAYRNTGSNQYDANIGGANATVIKYLMGVVVSSDGKLFSGKDGYLLQTISDKNEGIPIRADANVTGLVPGMEYAVKAPVVVNAALSGNEAVMQTITIGTGTSQTVIFKYTEGTYFYVKNGTTTTNYTYTDMVAKGVQVPNSADNTAPYGYSRPMYYRYNGMWLETLLDGISDISSVKLIAKDGSKETVSAADIKDYFVAYNHTNSKTSTNTPENKRITTTYEDAKIIIPGEGENIIGSAADDYTTAGKDVGILLAEADGAVVTKKDSSSTGTTSSVKSESLIITTDPKEDVAININVTAKTDSVGKAIAEVSSSQLSAALTDAVKAQTKTEKGTIAEIKVGVTTDSSAKNIEVVLPIGAVKKIADTENIQLAIVTGFGTITLSQALLTEALKSTSSGNLKINITPLDKQDINIIGVLSGNVKNVFNISITVDGNIVTEFGSQKIKISLPYTLNGTEKSEGLCVYYIDGTGKVSLMAGTQYDSKTKQITFETNHLSFYAVGYDDGALSKLFTDVSGKHWAKDAIGYVVGKGYFNGTSDTKFEPENAMTRSMFVTVIGRVYSEDLSTTGGGFTDVPNAKWYTQSVNWAAGNGIVSGVASDKFAPESPVTREQMAAFMYRYAQWAGYDMTVSKTKNLDAFNDAGEVSSWAKDAMIWAVDKGLISGVTTNTLEPRTSATRAQVGAIVQRFAENVIPADKVISGEASSQKSTASNSSSSSKSTDPYTTVPSSGTYLTVKGSGLVNKIYLTESNLRGLGTQDVTYTGRNKEDDNARQFVLFTCVDITKILNAAGYKGTATTLRVTCADGFTKNYNLSEIMNDCVAFTNTSTPTNYWVPASVALLSDGTFRLVYGQEATDTDDAKSFNMLGWAKDLKEIEIY